MDAIKIEPSTEKRDNMKHIMETFLKRAELFKKAKDSGVSLGGGKAVQNILDEKQIGVAAAIESKEPNSSHSLVEKQEEKAATLSEEESDEPREPRPAPDVVAATPEEPVPTPPVRPPRPALFQTPAASDNDEDNFLLPEVFSPAAEEVESPPPIPPRPPYALSPSKKRQLAVEAKAKADADLTTTADAVRTVERIAAANFILRLKDASCLFSNDEAFRSWALHGRRQSKVNEREGREDTIANRKRNETTKPTGFKPKKICNFSIE